MLGLSNSDLLDCCNLVLREFKLSFLEEKFIAFMLTLNN